jgi:hypothetical protein
VINRLRSNLPYYGSRLVCAFTQALGKYAEGNHVRVVPVSRHDLAPQSLTELLADRANGILYVSSQDSESSIYGVSGNVVFRAFHDAGHMEYNRTFQHEDEVILGNRQWLDIKDYIPAEDLRECQHLYHADTVGMAHYADLTGGKFPTDQTDFVLYVASRVATGTISMRDAVGDYVNKEYERAHK